MLNLLYSNLTGDFVATANSGAKTITFSSYASTVLSSVIATKSFLGASIKRVATSGAVDSLPLTNIVFSSNVLTLSGMSANFASGDQVAVVLIGPDKGYDEANDVMNANLWSQIAGENLTLDVMGFIFKPVSSSTYSPSNYKDKGTVTKANVKNAAGSVFSLRVTNANAAIRYFQLHNKATAPTATETASRYWVIAAGSATAPAELKLTINDFAPSWYLSTGIGWAISTTADTFTDSATAGDHTYDINYV
jgi:hypothetical protein